MNNLEEKIKHLEKQLNDINIVEGKWYRMSHCAYEMICYVNNVIALHRAENYEHIPVFILRAKKFLLRQNPSYLSEEYIALVINYIEMIEIKLINYCLTEKVFVASESLVLDNNFSFFEENSWLYDDYKEEFWQIQLFRSRIFFLGQALNINKNKSNK